MKISLNKLVATLIEHPPMTDREAARYVAHTHPLTKQKDEKPEDFVLRIVRAYDWCKARRYDETKPPNKDQPSK